ncbi:exodeoxyribonuclease III, partial [Spraguea lophii 42_110]
MKINIVSFNVNGLKSFSKYISLEYKDFNTYLLSNCIDILCIQESRGLESNLLEFKTLKDYIMFNAFNKKKNGMYGVSTFVKKNLYCSGYKIYISEELKEYCDEGRLLMTEHGDFKILNCYFPYIDDETYYSVMEKRERVLRFYNLVGEYLRKNKNIIICGDFNAMYSMMDSFVFVKELKRLCFEKDIEYNFYNIKKI